MYMFPIKPSIASDMVHVHKTLGDVQIFYSSHFNSMQKLKLQNQFEGKVLWSNLSFMGKYSHNKRSLGLKASKLASEKCIVHVILTACNCRKNRCQRQ